MRVAWTSLAADDLEQILDYLYEQRPATAVRVVRKIYSAASALREFPNQGRPGRKEGTRELIIPGLPYLIIYEVGEQKVQIMRVLHGAQRWP